MLTAQRELNRLEDRELSMLVYLSCRSEAREILNQMEISEMTAEGGLTRMLRLLDEAYGTRADERFEEKHRSSSAGDSLVRVWPTSSPL